MDNVLITEEYFQTIAKMIQEKHKSEDIINHAESLLYATVNGQKMIKLIDKRTHRSYVNALYIAFQIEDKKVYNYLIKLIDLLFNHKIDIYCFLLYLEQNDTTFITNFLELIKNKNVAYSDSALSVMMFDRQYTVLFHLFKNKTLIKKLFIFGAKEKQPLFYFLASDVRQQFDEQQINTINITYKPCHNGLLWALILNDIVSLNILLMTGEFKIHHCIFKDSYLLNNEAMLYLRMVYHLGLDAMQEKLQFNLMNDYDQKTNDKLIKAISHLSEEEKKQYNTKASKKIKIKSFFSNEKLESSNEDKTLYSILSNIKSLFSKKLSNDDLNNQIISNQVKINSKKDNYQFVIHTSFSQLDEKLKNYSYYDEHLFDNLKNILINIVLMSEFKNNSQIQNDIQLILHKTLPSLIHSYTELIHYSQNNDYYFQELKKAIAIMEHTFSEHLLLLRKNHEEKLVLNFSENIAFVEKKFLNQKN
jgi:hypothetical protein